MKENKTITLDDAFELTEEFRSERAVERFLDSVTAGEFDKYIKNVDDLKAKIAEGDEWSFLSECDYCQEKINVEEWEVVEEWIVSEGYEMNDDCETYTKA